MAMTFPLEIWWQIAEEVTDISDLASLGLASTELHDIVNPLLYRRAADSIYGLRAIFWGVRYGLHETVNNVLAAGVDPDIVWHSEQDARMKTELVPTIMECRASAETGITETNNVWSYKPRYWSPLHLATLLDDLEMVRLLLRNGARLNIGSFGICNCYERHELVRRFGSSIYFSWQRHPSWTPYHVAICAGSTAVTEFFMRMSDDTEMECFEWYPGRIATGVTAFHIPTVTGNLEMLRTLTKLIGKADVEAPDANGATPLAYACWHGNWECASYLISLGADINRVYSGIQGHGREGNGLTLLADMLRCAKLEECVQLLQLGADVKLSEQMRRGSSLPLIHQLCHESWDAYDWEYEGFIAKRIPRPEHAISGMVLLNRFIDEGLDFHQSTRRVSEDDWGDINTPLGLAAGCGNVAAAKRLIEAGADVNGDPEKDMMTPLAWACNPYTEKGTLELVNLLLDSGASVNRLKDNTKAPLWSLLEMTTDVQPRKEFEETVTDLLLKRGSNPGRGTSSGDREHTSALESRLYSRDYDGFRDLRSRSPPDSIGDDDFLGFWNTVSDLEDMEAVRYVLGDDADGVIARKSSALNKFLTELPEERDLILMLLEKGANPNGNCENVTPLVYVMKQRKWPLERRTFLLEALLKAKASIYKKLDSKDMLLQYPTTPDGDLTPLEFAIKGLNKTEQYMETMLEMQPLRDSTETSSYHYLTLALDTGNFKALAAISKSSEVAHATLRKDSSGLVHRLLDGIPNKICMRDINTTCDCLEFLIENGADLSAPAPPEAADKRTAKEKIRSYMELDKSPQCSSMDKGLAQCCRQKMNFPEDAEVPSFKPETIALFFQLHTTIESLGRIEVHARCTVIVGGNRKM